MSSKTVSKTKVKNLNTFQKVAEKNGITVTRGKNLSASDRYITIKGADMILDLGGSKAGLVSQTDGTYQLQMDNYGSRLASKFGPNCANLMRDYAVELAKEEVMNIGGVIESEVVTPTGWVEICVGLP